ncbi:hypothetical protein H6G00_09550 [Leptolyngbya sp. FACHB-541]|uniref:hypothetical protein n=1 Tax=Leptolyngbya sp. FACHB-541 TaxID=2692810 RepID=UPI0016897595|nr:hypothetical protein [Leptolyngbya sp. FACHB-541]MBD1996862.1 hypothetical protein [Leptolyngbya sp. FACHB-541]
MNEFQSSEDARIVPNRAITSLSTDGIRAAFYYLNVKPDTELRLLPDGKILTVEDIKNLNEQIIDKLTIHDITANITSINFILSGRKVKDYSAWNEFERANWDAVNETVRSISVTWEILIKLPTSELPQKHSLKLRIGTAIPPKDMFQLFFSSDDVLELLEAGAAGVCKVDFVNHIIAIELLNIVSNWYEGLKDAPKTDEIQRVLKKQERLLLELIRNFIPILFLILTYSYSPYLLPFFGIGNNVSLDNLQKVFILMMAAFSTGTVVGRSLARLLGAAVDRYEEYPKFSMTRGDKNTLEKTRASNTRITQQIVSRSLWTVFAVIISFLFRFLIDYTLHLKI